MKRTKMSPRDVAPSSPVLRHIFVTALTVLTRSFYSEMIFKKFFKKAAENFQISNVFKMPCRDTPELCTRYVESG